MTAAAGRVRRPARRRGAGARGRRAARPGPDPPHRALHAHGPVQPPLGRAHRAAHLAAVVHADGRARRAGDRGRPRRAHHDPPAVAVAAATSSGSRTSGPGASAASCGGATRSRSGTAATRSTPAPSRRRARAGSATPTSSTRGSAPGCGRSRRSAGPSETPDLRAFYPTDVLSTARDILFLWVARMVMLGLEFTGDIPFDDVYVHSVIQAPDGRRMSKSLGTGIDPIDEIDRHGADAVRFGLLAMSSTQDVKYSSEKVQQGQRAGEQAVQRLPVRAAQRPGGRGRAAAADGLRPLDPLAAAGGEGGVRRQRSTASTSPRARSASTTSSTASSATGTSSSPRAASSTRTSRRRCSTSCARRSRSRTR